MQHKLTQNNLKCRGIAINAAPTPNPATGQCTNCHISQNLTANNYCGMCHAYGTHPSSTKSTINVTATADKASYAPGEAMVVTISGGYRARTARAVVFDGPNPTTAVQKAISTGTLDPVGGAPINAPAWTGSAPATIILSSFTAPTAAGTYTWCGAWYGNDYDLGIIGGATTFGLWTADPRNPGHGCEMAAFTFTVVAPNPCAGFVSTPCTVTGQFGPCAASQTVCDPTTGAVTCPQTVFPAPAEICTGGIDEDCNNLIDCADPACATDPNCQVGDVGLKKLIVPNHMTMKVGGRERDRLINVQARVFGFDEDVMAMVTLTAAAGAGLSVEIDPASITKKMNEHGVTVFHFMADIACMRTGTWAINWTATIAGEQNTDPANDTLTDVTQVRCQNQGNSGNGNAGNKSKDPKASNGNNAADTGKDNNAANGGGNGSSDNNAGGNSIANANAGGNANSNANVNAGGNGNGNNKDKDKDKSKNK